MRLFFAFDVPAAENARVQEAVDVLTPQIAGARWIPPANRHVTVRFIGSVDDEAVDGIKDAARRACAAVKPGIVFLEGIGAFPRSARARVLWAGVQDPDSVVAKLFEHLELALVHIGFAGEERDYTPHLTLARMKAPVPLPRECAVLLPPGEPFRLDRLLLMESKLSPGGARYEVRDSFPLG